MRSRYDKYAREAMRALEFLDWYEHRTKSGDIMNRRLLGLLFGSAVTVFAIMVIAVALCEWIF